MNPATSNGTRQQPGNAVCRHEPPEPVVATRSVCKHCGSAIEAKPCIACDGMGVPWRQTSRCCVCRGTGIDRWEAAR